ncbi:MAG: hypothetical protein KGV44_00125 [Flavobacteriaceae bacterium]|nr:hypothetical protein [Flavobacteriaceae bacterium]
MYKFNFLGIALLAVMFLTSCSGVPREREVIAKDVEISGFANKYLKVVDGNYKFTNDGSDAFITVKFELKSKPKEKVCQDYAYGVLQINAIGDAGEIFNTGSGLFSNFQTDDTELKKIIELINTGNKGDKKSISFKWLYYSDDKGKSIFEKATSFEIIDDRALIFCSEKEKKEKKEKEEREKEEEGQTVSRSTSSSSTSFSKIKTSKNKNWDRVLKSYENYIDQYIKLMKKMQNGDMSVMTEYTEMMKKATDLAEKMQNAGSELSTSQMTKFMKLQTKLANASAGM